MSNLHAVLQPLLRDGFVDDLPKMLVCVLSGRQDCGLEAELTKTVTLELGKPLLVFMSSLRSQTCFPMDGDDDSFSLSRLYVRMGESASTALDSLQQTLISILSGFPLSGSLMGAVSCFADAAVTNVSTFVATLLQVPLDFIRIALQFGVRVPSLDAQETCKQGQTAFSA